MWFTISQQTILVRAKLGEYTKLVKATSHQE